MAGQFVIDLQRFTKKANADVKQAIRKITLEAFKRVIFRTPVDTGRARANWSLSTGAPVTFSIVGEDKSGSDTLKKTSDGVMVWECTGGIFLSNNLPYILTLEYGGYPKTVKYGSKPKGLKAGDNPGGFGEILSANGFSLQAPNGMVRITVAEMQAWARSASNVKSTLTEIRSQTR